MGHLALTPLPQGFEWRIIHYRQASDGSTIYADQAGCSGWLIAEPAAPQTHGTPSLIRRPWMSKK